MNLGNAAGPAGAAMEQEEYEDPVHKEPMEGVEVEPGEYDVQDPKVVMTTNGKM